jgi:hypothetical protein
MKFHTGFSMANLTGNDLADLIMFAVWLYLAVLTAWWAFADAKARGRNPWLVVLFVMTTGWPISIWWWQWLRPPEIKEKPKTDPNKMPDDTAHKLADHQH